MTHKGLKLSAENMKEEKQSPEFNGETDAARTKSVTFRDTLKIRC